MQNYNGNSANVAGQLAAQQVTISEPVDGDSFTASNDNARTRTEADWLQLVAAPFMAAYTWLKAQTFAALATFSVGFTSTAGPNTMGSNTSIAEPTKTAFSMGSGWSLHATSGISKFWLSAQQQVHLEICADASGAASVVFATLPAGMRPAQQRFLLGYAQVFPAAAAPTPIVVQVDTNGNITPGITGPGITSSTFICNTSFSLNG